MSGGLDRCYKCKTLKIFCKCEGCWLCGGKERCICEELVKKANRAKNPTLYMMIGMPGSGKSRYIKENLPNIPILSKDMMRLDIFRKDYDQANEIYISRISRYLSDILVESRISFILDETHLKIMRRQKIIELYKDKMYIIGIFIDTSLDVCKERRKHFPEGIMDKKWHEFEIPIIEEKFDELLRITGDKK